MFTELKESVVKEIKEGITISYQIETINKKMKIRQKKMKTLKLKSITTIKLTRGVQQQMRTGRRTNSELEDRSTDIIQVEGQKGKKQKKAKQILRVI